MCGEDLVNKPIPCRDEKGKKIEGMYHCGCQYNSNTMILDADFNNSVEVIVLDKRKVYSTVVGIGENQKPFDVMTNRLTEKTN
jgi:hypothetical protein